MQSKTLLVFMMILLFFTACKKDETKEETISPKGPYAGGVLLLSNSSKEVDGPSELSFVDEQGKLSTNVFSKENKDQLLSPSAMSITHFNNRYYITSSQGPNHLTVIDDQSLKLDYNVTQSGISCLTYFTTTDGKTGYANVTNRKKPGLYPVDLLAKNVSGTMVTDTKDIALVPVNKVDNSIVTGAGKRLVKIDNNVVKVLYTYKENVSGVVKTANKVVWVGVQGFSNKSKFIKLDQNFKAVDSVELDNAYKLPANGILTASGQDEYIYWQETSAGVTCRFNTMTKTAEKFIDHAGAGIIFATAWKVNPKNGDLYIADSPGLFMGEMASSLFIFDQKGKLKKEIKNAGYGIIDILFTQ
eukprot:gene17644-21040_t